MEQKSAALQSSLDKQNNCIKDNTKQKLKNLKEGADGRQPSGFSKLGFQTWTQNQTRNS